jgi:casein kinase II subunit alpha
MPPEPPDRDDDGDQSFSYPFGNIDDYSIGHRVGHGKYSDVFQGYHKLGDVCVIKVLKPVRLSKIDREIRILEQLRGGPHIAQLFDVLRDPDSKSIALILEWANNENIRSIIDRMTIGDIAIYMRGVLTALKFAHARGIMHRDIKPGNIMFNMAGKYVYVIDWGLAEYYKPGAEYQVRVATRSYKGPELLLNFGKYSFSLDIWCLGCTFASLLFRKVPFFNEPGNPDQIITLSEIFGAKEILDYVQKYHLDLPPGVPTKIAGKHRKAWQKFVPDDGVVTDEALNLLDKMLTIDHCLRISAAEALNHPFFQTVPQK